MVEAPEVDADAGAGADAVNGAFFADEEPDENAPVEAPPVDVAPIRVALIGSTLIEREQRYGYWETWLAASQPQQRFVVRNLGWSGDTVQGESRAGFGKPRDGYDKLLEEVRGMRPDVVIIAYGANASFEGEEGLASFQAGLDQLLRDLRNTRAQMVLMSPPPFEDAGVSGVDTTARNRDLALYAAAIRETAEDWEAEFVDLFAGVPSLTQAESAPRTDNGMHLSAYGYWLSAPLAMSALAKPVPWRLSMVLEQDRLLTEAASGTMVIESRIASQSAQAMLTWSLRDEALPASPPPGNRAQAVAPAAPSRTLQIRGLPPGRYSLCIDRQEVAAAAAEEWARGVALRSGPDFRQVEELRAAVIKKNELFFHRWRPQNETYLFGFRKHEQGQNAREIPQFDPLVTEMEDVIASLSQPSRRYYELRRLAD